MLVFLNGKEIEIAERTNISDFIAKFSDVEFGFALALNGTVIKKENWTTTFLSEDDKIILIKAVCGG